METKPTAFHSLDEWVSETQISAAATIYNPTVSEKKAPAAEPEGEDIDLEISCEIKKSNMSERKVVISSCSHTETESAAELNYTETHQTLCGDDFPPPPSDFSDFPGEEDYSVEIFANELMDNDMPDLMYDPNCCQIVSEKISTNLIVRDCFENSECIVSSLPFMDESDENFNVDTISELGVFVPEVEQHQSAQREVGSERDVQAITVNVSSTDLGSDLSLVSNIQSGRECSGEIEVSEETFEPNALPNEQTATNTTVFSLLRANDNEDDKTFVDILHNFGNASESICSTSLVGNVSQHQGELFPQSKLPSVTDLESSPEYTVDVPNVDTGESQDLPDSPETNAFPDQLSQTYSTVHSPLIVHKTEDDEVYTNNCHYLDYKSNLSNSTVSSSHVKVAPEQQRELSLHSGLSQASQEYCYSASDAESEENDEDTIEPIDLVEEITNLTVSTSPSNSSEQFLQFPFPANETNDNEESDSSVLLNCDCTCDVSGSTAASSFVIDLSKQQGEPSQQHNLASQGVNQEVIQQVLSQASAPLSAVSIAPANHTALSKSCGGVIGESRVGHGAVVRESRAKGTEEMQFKEKTVGPIGEILKSVQEQKSEKPGHVGFQHRTMESDSCDESDSGVSADFSPGSTLDSNSISTIVKRETPIEREIRKAIEREHSLRRSRGLPNPPTSTEYVEIPLRKEFSYQPLTPTKSEKSQGKDRQFAGKKMQQDIHEEAKREQDLVKLGKIPGFYDKGTVRQLKDKKMLFEAFQKPCDSRSVKSYTVSSTNDVSSIENDSLNHKVIETGSDKKNELTIKSPKVVPEAKSCQIILIENKFDLPTARPNTNTGGITVVDSGVDKKTPKAQDENELDSKKSKENPFFKLRSSASVVKVEQDIREAQERERELHKQRIKLYGTRQKRGGGRTPGSEEHSGALSPVKALPVQDLPDSSQTTATPTTEGRHSTAKLGVWPPAPPEKNHQTEVHLCPRVPRQKNPLVLRWESGLINAQED